MTTMEQPRRKAPDQRTVAAIVFAVAVALTATLIWIGLADHPWPRWLLALTMIF